MVLHIFAHNFLNIQLIFNLKKFWKLRLRAFQPYHQMLCMLKHVGGVEVKITFNTFNLHSNWYGWKALGLSFLKLFADWKLVEYKESYEQKCVYVLLTPLTCIGITALIVYIELLLTPLTYIAFDPFFIVQYFTHTMFLNTFDTFDMSNITLYWGPCMHFWHLWHEEHNPVLKVLYALLTALTWVTLLFIKDPVCTFDTSNISDIALYWGAYPLNYTVGPDTKSSNYNKIWLKALNYFELETLWIR